jgi:hypothetical protein
MANSIKLLRSSVPGKQPLELGIGELALNYYDGKLYFRVTRGTESFLYEISATEVGPLLGDAPDLGSVTTAHSAAYNYGSITDPAIRFLDYGVI